MLFTVVFLSLYFECCALLESSSTEFISSSTIIKQRIKFNEASEKESVPDWFVPVLSVSICIAFLMITVGIYSFYKPRKVVSSSRDSGGDYEGSVGHVTMREKRHGKLKHNNYELDTSTVNEERDVAIETATKPAKPCTSVSARSMSSENVDFSSVSARSMSSGNVDFSSVSARSMSSGNVDFSSVSARSMSSENVDFSSVYDTH